MSSAKEELVCISLFIWTSYLVEVCGPVRLRVEFIAEILCQHPDIILGEMHEEMVNFKGLFIKWVVSECCLLSPGMCSFLYQ